MDITHKHVEQRNILQTIGILMALMGLLGLLVIWTYLWIGGYI